jgi:hypothetical protein
MKARGAHLRLGFGLATSDERLGGGWRRCSDGPWTTARARWGSGRGGEGDGVGEDLGCFQIRRWEAAGGALGDGELQTRKDTMNYYKEKMPIGSQKMRTGKSKRWVPKGGGGITGCRRNQAKPAVLLAGLR